MNYKNYTINGMHGCGFSVVSCNTVYTFNRLASAKDFIDGMTTTLNKEQLFLSQAPQFNFELDANQILAKALRSGFVTEVGTDKYLLNESY